MDYQAKLTVPLGVLGIRCSADALTGIDFLPATEAPQAPVNMLAAEVCRQLLAYFADPHFTFSLPLELRGTPHQRRVWHAMQAIPCGETRNYGELAGKLHSGAQAIGQACGANLIPIVIPCHRVVSKTGLGGFMQHAGGEALDIKRWLLVHEAALPLSLAGRGPGRG